MKRHNARIIGVMTIFNLDMNNELNIDEVSDQVVVKELFFTKMDEIKDLVLDDEYSVEIDQSFLNDLLNFVVENYLHIYKIISSSLQNWTIDRISYVDRAIMICACAEMMMGLVPKGVIINEYLDITREYSMTVDEKQVKFNNRVLENIGNNVYEQ